MAKEADVETHRCGGCGQPLCGFLERRCFLEMFSLVFGGRVLDWPVFGGMGARLDGVRVDHDFASVVGDDRSSASIPDVAH
jgi:hypothetical protein